MRRIVVPTLALALFGCTTPNGRGPSSTNPKVVKVSIGGSVSGLAGSGLVLQNGADDLAVRGDGSFSFVAMIDKGTSYAVTVAQQPSAPSQTCVVGSGSGPPPAPAAIAAGRRETDPRSPPPPQGGAAEAAGGVGSDLSCFPSRISTPAGPPGAGSWVLSSRRGSG